MNKHLNSILSLLVASCFCCHLWADDKKLIESIKKKFYQTNQKLSQLKQESQILEGLSSEGAELKAYHNSKHQIVRMDFTALGETGKFYQEFYFDEKQMLVFSYSKTINYNGHIMETVQGKQLKETIEDENRYYLNEGRLIRWMKFKKIMPTDSKVFSTKQKSLLQDARSYLDKFKKK